MVSTAHFSNDLFEFLEELQLNNNRGWFQENKNRYQTVVLRPMLDFVADFGSYLPSISPYFVADPRAHGGSVFRIYRDVRFSKDKSPYKTHASMHFRHEMGRKVHGPGFYLHLAPGEVFAGAGIWHPGSESLGKIRDAIAASPARWTRVISDDDFAAAYVLEGESLKRPPRGYDPDHPMIDDLKRKDFAAVTEFSQEAAIAPDFIDIYASACRKAAPLMGFLTKAVGLAW